MYKRAPLSSSFMLVGILGFIITISFWIIGERLPPTWGFTLTLFFIIIFVASLVSLRATVVRLEAEKKPVVVRKRVVKRKSVKKKVAKKRTVKRKPAKKKKVVKKKAKKKKSVRKKKKR